MKRALFEEEHEIFRRSVRQFLEKEVVPHHEQWEKDGIVPREIWESAGAKGFLCMDVPEQYGGPGVDDFRFNAILDEETSRVGASGLGFVVHSDIVGPYILHYGSEDQKKRWLPKMVTGETITAIAMSEPGTGSDLQGVRTTAIRENGSYVLNGSKTFITNGIHSDLVIVVAKTDPNAAKVAYGTSLIVAERGAKGFERGRNLEKMGLKAQDTAELFFQDCRVPAENLLGKEGEGFFYLMNELPQERLAIAVGSVAGARAALELTVQYCQERTAFGRPIGKFQNSRFKMAEMLTEIEVTEAFVDRCIQAHLTKDLSTMEASMAKWWASEMLKRVVDTCVQLHGGYGYMMEYPIAKHYLDARVQTIYGGTTEIMKEIIGRGMGF
jgi:alkylation response protein AidB-like acyl-CoA dehydrogenase